MINKIIHYCWFGGNPLDSTAIKCLESWKKHFPDYEIIQWNEDNFDVNQMDFMAKAYEDKKWAFVSDVARLIIVYEHGGLYFDTDVEVIKSYDDILEENVSAFLGLENGCVVNSGLGYGAEKNHPFLKRLIEEYEKIDYIQYRDHVSDIACPIITTDLLMQEGFIKEDRKQTVSGVSIYPSSYFSPLDYHTGEIRIKEETHSIHWYSASWQDEYIKKEQEKMRKLRAIFGVKIAETIYGVISCMKKEGLINYIKKRVKRIVFRK